MHNRDPDYNVNLDHFISVRFFFSIILIYNVNMRNIYIENYTLICQQALCKEHGLCLVFCFARHIRMRAHVQKMNRFPHLNIFGGTGHQTQAHPLCMPFIN